MQTRATKSSTKFLVSAALLLFLPASAFACIASQSCFCQFADTKAAIVVAHVVSTVAQSDNDVAKIDSVDATAEGPTNLAANATVTANLGTLGSELRVGEFFLGIEKDGGLQAISRIDNDGLITCQFAPSFRVSIANAKKAVRSTDCFGEMRKQGFVEPPCNDFVTPLSVFGCSSGSSGGFWGGIVLLIASCVLFFFSKRRLGKGSGINT